MDVISRRTLSSSLNPNAPLFVPLAYQTVEDFSDEWWALIQSSPWFRDYWLQECYEDDEEHHPQNDYFFSEIDDPIFPDIDALFDGYNDTKQEEEEEEEEEEEKEISYRDLVTLGALKWRKSRVLPTRNREKVPKIVNVKVSPRPIQQPR